MFWVSSNQNSSPPLMSKGQQTYQNLSQSWPSGFMHLSSYQSPELVTYKNQHLAIFISLLFVGFTVCLLITVCLVCLPVYHNVQNQFLYCFLLLASLFLYIICYLLSSIFFQCCKMKININYIKTLFFKCKHLKNFFSVSITFASFPRFFMVCFYCP